MKISKALVFDIKRFAVHDGDGIRTTIFFKGCPLRCQWCQNPEGLSRIKRMIYFESKCIHCRICEKVSKYIEYREDRPYFDKNLTDDKVIKMCPSTALRYDSHEYSVEELVEMVKKDGVFFKDGGGVTVSGGEPLIQGEFLVDLLKRLKQENIHTAIETSFYASLDLIKRVLPYLDMIYVDLKLFDEKIHEEYTGVSSCLIKENIKYLLESEHKDKVIIRTPLIPHITADYKNIKEISQFIVNIYPDVKYELLNYNPLASSKYPLVDLEYKLDKNLKMFNKQQMKQFYDIVYQSGIKNLIRE